MRLYEFEAKDIFRTYKIPVPTGVVVTTETDLSSAVEKTSFPIAMKSQVLTGGRGLAGGIQFAETKEQAAAGIKELLGSKIKGYTVKKVLLESKAEIEEEIYLGITLDKENNCPVFIASSEGGVNIERVAEKTPEKILKIRIDVFKGLSNYELRRIAKKVGVGRELYDICKKMYTLFMERDANLVEINPLVVTRDGSLQAVDAKVVLDNKASYRQQIFSQLEREGDAQEKKAEEYGLSTYIELDGDIGLISDGAGTGMLTLDLISDEGGKAANFSEMGGVTTPDTIKNAMILVSSNPSVKVMLISMIGGLNRMDEMSEGIIAFFEEHEQMPVVIRMSGTLEDVGKKMLHEEGFETFDNLYEAVQKAVELAGAC